MITPPCPTNTDTIGAIKLADMDLTLCDYIQAVDGRWYALAYYNAHNSRAHNMFISKPDKNNTIHTAYLPLNLLQQAVAHDGKNTQTTALINRLATELSHLNAAAPQ